MAPAPANAVATSSASSSSDPSLFVTRMVETAKSVFSNRRGWGELFGNGNADSFSRPQSFAEGMARARSNIAYFHGNYAVIVAAAILLSFLKDPSTLMVVVLLGLAWGVLFFWKSDPLVLFGREISDQTLLAGLSIFSVITVFLSGAFWNIFTAVAIALVCVVCHAVLRNTDDLFLDEESAAKGGLVSNVYTPIPTRRG